MHNALERVQTTFGSLSTIGLILSAIVSLISIGQLYSNDAFAVPAAISNVEPKVTLKYTRRMGSQGGKAKENCALKFDLKTDLRPLFNWNTKQVFAYLTAEYSGMHPDTSNTVTFWDKIITTKDHAVLDLKNLKGKYLVYDVSPSFRGREAKLRLYWNVQPHVGLMVYGQTQIANVSFAFPPSS